MRFPSATEREAYDKPPILNATERRRAFDLPSSLFLGSPQRRALGLKRIGLPVSVVYFATARYFFPPRDYRERDVA